MSLGVTGDEFTGLMHFVHVPEAFERRFAEMRAANNAIARVASLGAGLLLRHRRLRARRTLAAAQACADLAPGARRRRHRRRVERAGDRRQCAAGVVQLRYRAIGMGVLGPADRASRCSCCSAAALALALVFMAAESLSRRAFPDHPQLWRAVVARRCADVRGARTHARRLSVRADRVGADRRVLFRHQPLLRLVAAVGVAVRSRISSAVRCRAWRRSAWRCRRGSWRSACSARCRCRWRR